ncbi:MAG TPA: phage tail protein [Candidatus Limnocylindrales bacterium]|nr:phage tail protein [Candidatus Limnocylindrales bacterium]
MTRNAIDGLSTPHPLDRRLPSVFREDAFTVRFVSAFDGLLAPVFTALDCLEGYLDPTLAPPDFVAWLAGWVAVDLDETWSDQQQRRLVAQAVALHRWAGTLRGLTEQIRVLIGGDVVVTDSGGCAWSPTAASALPGRDGASVHVRVTSTEPVEPARLRAVLSACLPAHVTFTIEVSP